jgi:transcriptional regulator with XRE-family HTH domain
MKKRTQKQTAKTTMSWGEMIRQKRVEKGLTQAELSAKLNYPNPQFISLMERSLSKIPLSAMGRMIEILDINENLVVAKLLEDYEHTVRAELRKSRKG